VTLAARPLRTGAATWYGPDAIAGARNVFNVRPDDISTAARNGRAPNRADGSPRTIEQYNANFSGLHTGATSNLPYHMVQMGANGAFFYLKASYSVGLQALGFQNSTPALFAKQDFFMVFLPGNNVGKVFILLLYSRRTLTRITLGYLGAA